MVFALRRSCFNPRPRTGGDTRPIVPIPECLKSVSIRAPARGATLPHLHTVVTLKLLQRFNPRPRTGGDGPPRQVDNFSAGRFNPRPRTGGDFDCRLVRRYVVTMTVSIRAPARGATQRSLE